MRRLLALLVIGLVGCGSSSDKDVASPSTASGARKDDPVPRNQGTTDKDEWTSDLSRLSIPERPATGRVAGKPFRVDRAVFDNNILELRQGKDFPELELKVFLLGNKESHEGKKYELPAKDVNAPGAYVYLSYREGEAPKLEEFKEKYALKLEFGKAKDGQLPGKIYVCAPDKAKSFVAGTFVAHGTGDDPRSRKLTPTDGPYVHGTLTLKGIGTELVTAGYVGLTATKAVVTNGAGMELREDVIGSCITSTTFAPRMTTLIFDGKEGVRYRHVRLDPGMYLFFVKVKEQCVAWKWLEVGDKAEAQLDLTVDMTQLGSAEVTVAKDAKDKVLLLPVDAAVKLPEDKAFQEQLAWWLKTEATPEGGVAKFEGLPAGSYRAVLGEAKAEVAVKAGGKATADLTKK